MTTVNELKYAAMVGMFGQIFDAIINGQLIPAPKVDDDNSQ